MLLINFERSSAAEVTNGAALGRAKMIRFDIVSCLLHAMAINWASRLSLFSIRFDRRKWICMSVTNKTNGKYAIPIQNEETIWHTHEKMFYETWENENRKRRERKQKKWFYRYFPLSEQIVTHQRLERKIKKWCGWRIEWRKKSVESLYLTWNWDCVCVR